MTTVAFRALGIGWLAASAAHGLPQQSLCIWIGGQGTSP